MTSDGTGPDGEDEGGSDGSDGDGNGDEDEDSSGNPGYTGPAEVLILHFSQARLYASVTDDAVAIRAALQSALASAGAANESSLIEVTFHSAADFSIAAVLFTAGPAGAAALLPYMDGLPVLFGAESIPGELILDSSNGFITSNVIKQGIARINAGGAPLGSSTGVLWDADFAFNGGASISATSSGSVSPGQTGLDVFLLQSARVQSGGQPLLYEIPVPLPGTYTVRLYFAEFQECCGEAGSRVFDIFAEGQLMSDGFDIAAVGSVSGEAQVVEFDVVAIENTVSIALVPSVGNALVSAVAVDIVSILSVIIEDVGEGSTSAGDKISNTTTLATSTSTSTATPAPTTPVPDIPIDDGVTGVDTNPATFVALGNFSAEAPTLSVKRLADASKILASYLDTELVGPAFLWASSATGDRPVSSAGDISESIDLTFPGQASSRVRALLPGLPASELTFQTTRYSAGYAKSRGVLVTVEVWEPSDAVQAVIQLRDDDGSVLTEGGIVELVLEPDATLTEQAQVALSAACEVPLNTVDGTCKATITTLPAAWFAVPDGPLLSPPPSLRARWRFVGDKNNKLRDLGTVTVQQRIDATSPTALITGTLPFAQQIRGNAISLSLDLQKGSSDYSYFLFAMRLTPGVVPQPVSAETPTRGWSLTIAALETPGHYAVAAKLINRSQSLRSRDVQRLPVISLLLSAAAPAYAFVTVEGVVQAARVLIDNSLATMPTDGSELLAFVSRTTLATAETTGSLYVLPNAIIGILPYAAANELVNTAVLSGERQDTRLVVLGVAVDGTVAQTTAGVATCSSTTPSLLQVSADCSSLYFDGSEFDGGEGSIDIDFGGLDPFSFQVRVWFPALPVTASLQRTSGSLNPVSGLLMKDCSQAYEGARFTAVTSFTAGDAETAEMAVSTFVRRQLRSSSPEIVQVLEDGTVLGVSPGTATLFASTDDLAVASLPVTVGGKTVSLKSTAVAVATGAAFDFLDNVKPHKAWKFSLKSTQSFALPNAVTGQAYAVATLSNGETMLLRPDVHDVFFGSLDQRTVEMTSAGAVTVFGPGGGQLASVRRGSCLSNDDSGGLASSAQLGGIPLASGYLFSDVPAIESLTVTISTQRIAHHSSAAARLGIPVVATLTMSLKRGSSEIDVTASPTTIVDASAVKGILGLVRTIDGGYRLHVSAPDVVGSTPAIVVTNGELTTTVLLTVVGTRGDQALEIRKVVNDKLQSGTYDNINRYGNPLGGWQKGELRFSVRLTDGSRLDVSRSALTSIRMTEDGDGVFEFDAASRQITVNASQAAAALRQGAPLPLARFTATYNGDTPAFASLGIGEPFIELKKVGEATAPAVVTGFANEPSGQYLKASLEYADGRTVLVYDGKGNNAYPGLVLAFSTNEARLTVDAVSGELIPVSSTDPGETVSISVSIATDISSVTVVSTAVLLDSPVGQGDFGDSLEIVFEKNKDVQLPISINVGDQDAVLLDASLYYDPAALTFVAMQAGKAWPSGGRLIVTHDAEAGHVRFAGIMLESPLRGYSVVVQAAFTSNKPSAGYVTGEIHALLNGDTQPIATYEQPLRPASGVLLVSLKKGDFKKVRKGKIDVEDLWVLPEAGVVGGEGRLSDICPMLPCTPKACSALLAPNKAPSIDFNNDCFFDVRDVAVLMSVAKGERTLTIPPGSSGLMAVLHSGDLDRSGAVDRNDVLLAMSTAVGAIPLLEEVDISVDGGGCTIKIVTSFLALHGGKASLGGSRLFVAALLGSGDNEDLKELLTVDQGTLVEMTPYPLYPKQWKQEQKAIAGGQKDKFSKFLPQGMVVEAVQNKLNSFVAEIEVQGAVGTTAIVVGFVDENTALREATGEGGVVGEAILLAGVPNNDGGGSFKDVDVALDAPGGQRFRLRSSEPFGGYASFSLASTAGCLTTPEQTTTDPDMTDPPTEPPTLPSTTTFEQWAVPLNLVFGAVVHRINCGTTALEGDFVDREGRAWAIDYGYEGPSQRSLVANAQIAGTRDDALFQTARFMTGGEPLRYSLPVPTGFYHVRLYFADTCKCTSDPNERRFDVWLEGRKVLQNLDLVATYGWRTAAVAEFDIIVEDNAVDISFGRIVQAPIISAIEVLAVSAVEETSTTTTTTSPTLPAGDDAMAGFALTFSSTENELGQRFGNAFRKADRQFAMQTVLESAATRFIFSRQCAERCLADASCQGFYVFLDDDETFSRRIYCIGLAQLEGSKKTGGDTYSYTRIAEAEVTTTVATTTLAGPWPLSQAEFNAGFLQVHSAQADGMRFRFAFALGRRVFRLEAPAGEFQALLLRCGATCQSYKACVGFWAGIESEAAICNGLDQTGTPKSAKLTVSRSFLRK
jgi:hypothetical protein